MISPITDLETFLIANYDYTNVNGLTANPNIRLASDEDPTSYTANGDIILENMITVRPDEVGNTREIEYKVDAVVLFENNVTTLQEMIDELDRIFIANNKSPTRTYRYYFTNSWDTNVLNGIIDIEIQVFKQRVII